MGLPAAFQKLALQPCRPLQAPFAAQSTVPSLIGQQHFRSSVYEGAKLKKPLTAESVPVLYTHVLCPYAQRAWLALLEKGIEFKTVNIDLSSKPGWYTRLTPAGLVPAVSFMGELHTESLDICKWVDENFGGRTLMPQGKEQDIGQLLHNCSSFVSTGMSLLAGTTGRSWGIGAGQTECQKQAFAKQLQILERAISMSGGPFLTGAEPSLADVVYFPFAQRFDVAMPEFCGYVMRTVSTEDGPISRWLDAMGSREGAQISSADRGLLLQAFRQHRSLDFFDFQTYAAKVLHPHLEEQAEG